MLKHDWFVPTNVAIAMTNRHGGVSAPPYDSLNLGLHVGDSALLVQANRDLLAKQLALPAAPIWLEQVHGTRVVHLESVSLGRSPIAAKLAESDPVLSPNSQSTAASSEASSLNALISAESSNTNATAIIADASYSSTFGQVCAVMTADCLAVLLCDEAGTEVAAAHAGWRGLCEGVIEASVAQFTAPASTLIAYLGPTIGPDAFEVGAEVKQAFVAKHPQAAACFTAQGDKFLADMVALAKLRLHLLGVTHIYSADICTVTNQDYFSYRRDNITGRMASLIWLKS